MSLMTTIISWTLISCSLGALNSDQATDKQEKVAPAPAIRVGAIADDGTQGKLEDVVFTVIDREGNESPVTRGEFQTEYQYRINLAPGMFRPTLMVMAVEDIVKLAAVRLYYQDAIAGLNERAAKVSAALEPIKDLPEDDIIARGNFFGKVANEMSDDPQIISHGRNGNLGRFGRLHMQYPFDRKAFEGTPGQIVGPFLSYFGYHFVFVDRIIKSHTPIADKCEARHILLYYEDATARPLKKAVLAMRDVFVRIDDPVFGDIVPLGLQIGEPLAMKVGEMAPIDQFVGSAQHIEQQKKAKLEKERLEAEAKKKQEEDAKKESGNKGG